METQQQPPQQVQEEAEMEMENRTVVPTPQEGRTATDWAERADRALEAREMGRKLRKGKRVLFPSMRSLSSH